MISLKRLMHVSSSSFPILALNKFHKSFISSLFLLSFLVHTPALSNDTIGLSSQIPPAYNNYAVQGSYMNPGRSGVVPEWNYYDIFGNHLVKGFNLYNMGMNGDLNSQESFISIHPILRNWLNGMVQVGDISDNRGILAMIGNRMKTEFTPYTFNQSLFSGARIDGFFNLFYGMNSVSVIGSQISNTGIQGGYTDSTLKMPDADWLYGIHFAKNINDLFEIGGTYINMHNTEWNKPNTFEGALKDSFPENTPTALSVYGIDGRCTFTKPNLTLYGEYARSQEVLGGDFKPQAGNIATLNTQWNVFDQLKFGGEGYIVQSRYKTTFYCPQHLKGDTLGSGRYLYSLVDDNDDGDDYPENGHSKKLNVSAKGDIDGTISMKYDKDKNGRFDYEEDFLNYDADPPKSTLYFDRNNNGVPDEIEDDPYPDYPYVPGYYLPGERYLRYDDFTGQWKEDTVGGTWYNDEIYPKQWMVDTAGVEMSHQVSKGLLGFHLYSQYQILPNLNLTLGAIYENSEKNSFQMKYQDGVAVGFADAPEKAITLYSLIGYQHDFARDKKLTVDNYFRMIKDNIPNHTQTSTLGLDRASITGNNTFYRTVVDQLDYRDALVEMLIGEYTVFRNRGFNLTTRGKFEFQKNHPHLEFNYTDESIYSLILTNKCEYIWLLPFFKDMFLIPKYKNIYEFMGYGPRIASLDDKYQHNSMINAAYLVYEWKFNQKTAITTGLQFTNFSDFLNNREDYFHGNWTTQLTIKDRYSGLGMIFAMGFSRYNYIFYNAPEIAHNPFNNPQRITENISSYDVFLKVLCGF
jgi:hypothetical protein